MIVVLLLPVTDNDFGGVSGTRTGAAHSGVVDDCGVDAVAVAGSSAPGPPFAARCWAINHTNKPSLWRGGGAGRERDTPRDVG